MEQPFRRPTGFNPTPIRVGLAKQNPDPADAAATKALLDAYTIDGVFHCPKCKKPIANPTEAVEHLIEEINEALGSLPV